MRLNLQNKMQQSSGFFVLDDNTTKPFNHEDEWQ